MRTVYELLTALVVVSVQAAGLLIFMGGLFLLSPWRILLGLFLILHQPLFWLIVERGWREHRDEWPL